MYSIAVHNGSLTGFNSYVIAGLHELQAAKELEFHYARPANKLPAENHNAQLWVTIHFPNPDGHTPSLQPRAASVIFDMMDKADICPEALASCDLYFKRSFAPNQIARLPADERLKILPMGIQFACVSPHETLASRLSAALVVPDQLSAEGRRGPRIVRRLTAAVMRRVADGQRIRRLPPLVEELECAPSQPANEHVYFRTRLFDPSLAATPEISQHLTELNSGRIEVVDALKRTLGKRFSGGLYPTATNLRLRPDLIFELPDGLSGKHGHLQMLRRSLITLNTVGVHGSTGWKFAESLASSRCLVNQRLPYVNQVPAEANRHFLEFTDAQESADICDELLSNPSRMMEVRTAAYEFFCTEVRPGNALRFSLEAARKRLVSSNAEGVRAVQIPAQHS